MGCCKSSPKREFIAIQSYLKKQEKHQMDNLTLHLKQLEKEEGEQQQQQKLVEINHKDPSRNK